MELTDTHVLLLITFGIVLVAPEICTIVADLCRTSHNVITGHRLQRWN